MDRYSRIQELSRALTESVTDLESLHGTMRRAFGETESLLLQQGRINATLQEGLMSTLLVPFARQIPRLQRLVSQTCNETGKRAQIGFDGTSAEMDRTVLERMTEPLEHLLRNSVVHGLEKPDARETAGKPAVGAIHVGLRREGAQLIIEIGDDGAGLNLPAIRKQAESKGLLARGRKLSDAELANFIFEPGFSTAETVSRAAGRGVGMDVVSTRIRQLGGTLDVHTEKGKGARFVVQLPLSLAVSHTLMASVGDELYAMPLHGIEGVSRAPVEAIAEYYAGGQAVVEYGGEDYELRYFGDLIGVSRPSLTDLPKHLPVLAVLAGDHRVALAVDSLAGSEEVVVKSVGPQVSTVPGVSGATIQANGNVVLIIDPAALLQAEMRRAVMVDTGAAAEADDVAQAAALETEEQGNLVLVVDDSITIRRVSERFLTRNGFWVATARDGMDALAKLQTEIPDVVLLDIEMPRIDGFEVATYMRNNAELSRVPIIMITSRSGEKHRERARSIGVDRYLIKPYQEDVLLAEINELLPNASSRASS
jgi:chemosensory pili system protein ChpA (sensor histidine kinase/response regulator)